MEAYKMLYQVKNRKPVAAVSTRVPAELYDKIRETFTKSKAQSMSEAAAIYFNELISTIAVQENKIEVLNAQNKELKEVVEHLQELIRSDVKRSVEK